MSTTTVNAKHLGETHIRTLNRNNFEVTFDCEEYECVIPTTTVNARHHKELTRNVNRNSSPSDILITLNETRM
jgi:hypothetical protein